MDCKSILGCVPILGWGIGGQRIYNEYHSAKDKKTNDASKSIFSHMDKSVIAHGVCEFVPIAGPLLYGSGKLICCIARKVCRLWEYIKQPISGPSQSNVQPAQVNTQSVVPAVVNLSEVANLSFEVLEKLVGERIILRTTEASIDMPDSSSNNEQRIKDNEKRIKEIKEKVSIGRKESNQRYERRIRGLAHSENAAQRRDLASQVLIPITQAYTGKLLEVVLPNHNTGRYKVRIKFESIDGFKPWDEQNESSLPYGFKLEETLSFYLSDEELLKFNPPPHP